MSSEWFYEGNKTIKKIYSLALFSIPPTFKWYVQLKDGLILDLNSDLINELRLSEEELLKIVEAKENARILASKKTSLLTSLDLL
jgi:hypothetical protein